jgi:hypothetical protein
MLMKLSRSEFQIIAKCIGVSVAIAASIPIILWIFGIFAGGAGGSDLVAGAVVVSIVVVIASVLLLPWRLFFDWSFLYSNWAWFAAADCLIIGFMFGLWGVRRRRRANAPVSDNPF